MVSGLWALLTLTGCASSQGRPTAGVAATHSRPTARPAPDFARQVLVTLPPGPERLWKKVTQELATAYDLEPVYSWPLPSLGENCIIYTVPSGRSPATLARRLAADPRVSLAQPIHVFGGQAAAYNDPYAHLQVGLATLRLSAAHGLATGKGVKVAIIDTGVDLSHPDLAGRVVDASNFISWGEAAFTGDFHGTAVAGVVAADANNQVGIVGVAPRAELLALKACWQDPPDSREARCNSYTLAQALDFALLHGAQVLNLSLAGPEDPLLAKLLTKALEAGITVVAAAPSQAGRGFPASLPGVLAVRAAELGGRVLADEPGATAVGALAAPGTDVLTTVPRGSYDFFTGSSMAAAQVSGVVALLLERRPGLSPAEVRAILHAASRATDEAPGVLDACRALAQLVPAASCP